VGQTVVRDKLIIGNGMLQV